MLNNNDLTNGQDYNELNGKTYKNDEKSLKLSTRAIHCGQSPSQWTHRSLIPPIVNSTAFELDVEQLFDENFKGNVSLSLSLSTIIFLRNIYNLFLFLRNMSIRGPETRPESV
jgi:hypothetical protein